MQNEIMIKQVVLEFYKRVRKHEELASIFNDIVADWDEHLGRLEEFWSSLVLGSGRYKGNPLAIHIMHADRIDRRMFEHWLTLWTQTTQQMLPADLAADMQAKAHRIADRLQRGMSSHRGERNAECHMNKNEIPAKTVPEPYKVTQDFSERSIPAPLLRSHATKAGVWGLIRISEGCISLRYDDGTATTCILDPENPGLVRPEQQHHLEPTGPVRLQVEFYDRYPGSQF